MPPRHALLLLIVGACPISASVIVAAIYPARLDLFGGDQLAMRLYFVLPALFAVIGSLATRNLAAGLRPETLLRLGVLGFSGFGLADGLNQDSAAAAYAARAGVGLSSGLLMAGFNRLAMTRFDRKTSTSLLTYLNMATSSYGLVVALAAGGLADWTPQAAFLLFGVPALLLAAYRGPRDERTAGSATPAPAASEPSEQSLPTAALLLVVSGHMAMHVMFYFHIAQSAYEVLGHRLGTAEVTAVYVLGHLMGAVIFAPVRARLASTRTHLVLAMLASLIGAIGLAVAGQTGAAGIVALICGGLGLSHVLPLVFASIRDAAPSDAKGKAIADAVASGFFGQLAAPFLLEALALATGSEVAPATASALLSVPLFCLALAIRLQGRRRHASI